MSAKEQIEIAGERKNIYHMKSKKTIRATAAYQKNIGSTSSRSRPDVNNDKI
jgi:hypothetical protein